MTETSHTLEPPTNWRQYGPIGALGLFWTAAPAIAGTVLLLYVGPIAEWLSARDASGLLIYVAVFIIAGGCGLLPTYSQSIVGGWVFGTAIGLPAALLGFTGASLLGYMIARAVSKDRVEQLIESKPRARAVREMLVGQGPLRTFGVVALLRVPPNSPFALTNLVMAGAGVATLPFLFGTIVGMLPRTAVAVVFAAIGAKHGRGIVELMKDSPMMFWGGVALMLVVLMIIGHAAKLAIARVERSMQDNAAAAPQPE